MPPIPMLFAAATDDTDSRWDFTPAYFYLVADPFAMTKELLGLDTKFRRE